LCENNESVINLYNVYYFITVKELRIIKPYQNYFLWMKTVQIYLIMFNLIKSNSGLYLCKEEKSLNCFFLIGKCIVYGGCM